MEERGDYCQAFADDIVLAFDGDTAIDIERMANAALAYVQTWGVKNKLKFAPHKTSAILVTRKLKFDTPRLHMGGVAVTMSRDMKILGVTIDDKLTFNTHVANVCRRATEIYKRLSRATKTTWGLHPEVIRTIYTATIEPVILYAASAWAPAAEKVKIRDQLGAVQRGIAQKLCKAYRTVSLNAALALAGILPLDLRVREAATLYEASRGVPQPALKGREVEMRASVTAALHPAEQADIVIGSLVDRNQLKQYRDLDIKIYTDGSRIEGRVGAALSIWAGGVEIKALKLALPEYAMVYQAELQAVCVATREAIKRKTGKTFGVFSNSMAALQTVQNNSCLHPLALETRENINYVSPGQSIDSVLDQGSRGDGRK